MLPFTPRSLMNFLKNEDGLTAVEYAVMLAFIILVCFASIAVVGAKTQANFQQTDAQISKTGS